jgi:methionine-rich copper-binding protein CopC
MVRRPNRMSAMAAPRILERTCRTVLVLVALLAAAPAGAEPARVMEMRPVASSVMDGNRQEFFIRFDRPIDHYGSRLEVVRDGQVVRTLAARLNAAPEVLFAIAGDLAPGPYILRWFAKSWRDGSVTEGSLDFSVR